MFIVIVFILEMRNLGIERLGILLKVIELELEFKLVLEFVV